MRSTSTAALSVFAVALSSMSARADDPSTVSVEDAASGCAFVNAPIKTTLYVDGCTSVICTAGTIDSGMLAGSTRSEEHTSELQSRPQLVCCLLLEKTNQETSQEPTSYRPFTPSTPPPHQL